MLKPVTVSVRFNLFINLGISWLDIYNRLQQSININSTHVLEEGNVKCIGLLIYGIPH